MKNMKNMKRRSLIIVCLCAVCGMAVAQKVSNVSAEQVGKNIVVSYDLDKAATISVCYSTDGGKTYSRPIKQVTGDVGKNVSAGHKQIIWNVLNEVEKLVCSNLVFKVTAGRGNETFTVKGVTFEMVKVEGGTFTMGATSEQGNGADSDEKPTHLVTLSDYYIGKYEVTQELWEAVMGNNIRTYYGSTIPMENISWDDCKNFISKLNSLLSSQLGGKHFALPTEAQWEYAARGGSESRGYKYSGSSTISNIAWYFNNGGRSSHTVGMKMPNELGIYDMSGNVWEWCQDWYGSYSSNSQTNPTGSASGACHVARGGSYLNDAWDCRVSNRDEVPAYRNNIGFRLVLIP
ncbi:MAG: formylglycine-generating enzyme family protein [Paludibacteraceae bacterium]|nr:formylglycine-generating enzyme family protein [Paludibacteraceae bacterium]